MRTRTQSLKYLEAFIRSLKLRKQTERYTGMARQLSQGLLEGGGSSESQTRPEELVRVYDTLVLVRPAVLHHASCRTAVGHTPLRSSLRPQDD